MNKSKCKNFILLHIILFIYSLAAIFSKLASAKEFLSIGFIFFYTAILVILFIYAVLWQQVLKRLPLNTAYANKSVVIIWGLVWGNFIFKERISTFMILGSILILVGLTLVVTSDE